jgi:hypothetical protein
MLATILESEACDSVKKANSLFYLDYEPANSAVVLDDIISVFE